MAPQAPAVAKLSVLNGLDKSAPVEARILNFSGRGMRINLPEKLGAGTLVRVDLDQMMILGEVCYAEPHSEGGFAMGLRLEHSLLKTTGLERLRQRFADEGYGAPAGEPAGRATR